MGSDDETWWRVMRPGRLRVRRFDDEVVVYDDHSGDTHLLDDRAGRILERLLRGSAGLDELARLGGPFPEDPGHDALIARAYEVVTRLRRQGIVKPVVK